VLQYEVSVITCNRSTTTRSNQTMSTNTMDTRRMQGSLAAGSISRLTRRALVSTPVTRGFTTGLAPTGAIYANATTGPIKVGFVAWHRCYTPVMHHHRRPEEVASP
jgi:hypothetical protein